MSEVGDRGEQAYYIVRTNTQSFSSIHLQTSDQPLSEGKPVNICRRRVMVVGHVRDDGMSNRPRGCGGFTFLVVTKRYFRVFFPIHLGYPQFTGALGYCGEHWQARDVERDGAFWGGISNAQSFTMPAQVAIRIEFQCQSRRCHLEITVRLSNISRWKPCQQAL